jgi:hypothetical protein
MHSFTSSTPSKSGYNIHPSRGNSFNRLIALHVTSSSVELLLA